MVVAPTALLGGSTYHYMFGINEKVDISRARLAEVKECLNGMDYIFLDEVSMLSCHDLHNIRKHLCMLINNDKVFSGMNFVFARDFAQLPSVIGGEHASLYSLSAGQNPTSITGQETALGKTHWHQVNTIVMYLA